MVKDENTLEYKAQAELSLTASKDDDTVKRERICRRSGKLQVMRTHHRKLERPKERSLSTSFTLLRVETEYASSQSTLSNSGASEFEDNQRSKSRQEGAPEVMQNVNTSLRKALAYRNYLLENKSKK